MHSRPFAHPRLGQPPESERVVRVMSTMDMFCGRLGSREADAFTSSLMALPLLLPLALPLACSIDEVPSRCFAAPQKAVAAHSETR